MSAACRGGAGMTFVSTRRTVHRRSRRSGKASRWAPQHLVWFHGSTRSGEAPLVPLPSAMRDPHALRFLRGDGGALDAAVADPRCCAGREGYGGTSSRSDDRSRVAAGPNMPQRSSVGRGRSIGRRGPGRGSARRRRLAGYPKHGFATEGLDRRPEPRHNLLQRGAGLSCGPRPIEVRLVPTPLKCRASVLYGVSGRAGFVAPGPACSQRDGCRRTHSRCRDPEPRAPLGMGTRSRG